MKSRASFLVAAFWMCVVNLAAQKEEFVSRHYSMKDGLPDDGVNCIIQDSRGFIWFGTYAGLSRFDGYNFVTYTNDPASSNSLRNNFVKSILEDKEGRLWIGHIQGVDVFDPRTGKFILHWPGSEDVTETKQGGKLRERRDGKIWACTSKGVYVANPETLEFEKFPGIPSCMTFDIAETQDGSIISASGSCGVIYIDAITNKTTHFKPDSQGKGNITPSSDCMSVSVDDDDRVWVGTNNGIYLFEYRKKTFTLYSKSMQLTRVISILENPDGKLWLGCRNGLYLFDPNTGETDKITAGHNFGSVLKDTQGVLWASSLQGVQQLSSKNKRFETYNEFGVIGTLIEDASHDLWLVGSQGYGGNNVVFKLSPSPLDGLHHQVMPLQNFGSSVTPRSLFADSDQNIWIASMWKLEKCNITSKTFQVINLTTKMFVPPITSFMDSQGTVWLGDWETVNKFDINTGDGEEILFPNSTVYSFMEDNFQNLWIGSTSGLGRYNLHSKKLDHFINVPNDPQSLSNNTVYNVTMDKEQTIWIGTAGGLNKMIKGTENEVPKFLSWRISKSGLPNDDVYCIVDGGDGTLWMTCGNKISHFFPIQNTFRNYDQNDGLSGGNFRGIGYLNGKGLRIHRGTILFGGTDGLVVFHPDSLQDNHYIPPIVITGFSIRNRIVPVKGVEAEILRTPLNQAISYTNEIKLAHDQNDFNFEFSSLNYVSPERNQYRYKLEPYENEWIETNANNRFARYTNINPGKYTFRVIGSNNDGIWNETGVSLVIIISPPWWRTRWSYTLYVMAFIGMFLYWRSYENKRLKLKHRAEHLSELDSLKTRFFANISHEFRTPITLILGPLKDLYNKANSDEQKNVLGTMLRNGQRLLRLINQLLDLSKLEAGKMTLQAAQTDMVQFLKEIASSYESLATDKKIKFFFYPEVQELITYIDHERMEKVVYNLLSNAFKFTNEGGEVILNLKATEEQGIIVVKDTGIGIHANQLDKVFDRFYQVDSSQTRGYEGSGLGMALAKELVELHHGSISVESEEGNGSTFTVRLPLGKDHLRKEEIIDVEDFRKTKIVSEDLKAGETFVTAESGNEITPASSEGQPVLLIVEDNVDMRHYIRKTLSDHYQIIEAENGKTGVTLAKETVPDLIISDIMMPEMDGYKLCEIIKTNELTSHIPIILLTAKADRESKLTGLETGADDYLSKPFDEDELKLIVRNRIEERRKMRERFSREITLEPKQISITSYDEKFLNKVLAIIESHIDDENFSVEELSREVGYSNMHLYRKLKALAGETPSQFLRTIRLKRAAELLRKKSDNVTQIAYSVGFSSLSYFNKCFKEQFGMTPGQFAE